MNKPSKRELLHAANYINRQDETTRRARLYAIVTGKTQTRTVTVDNVTTIRHHDDINRKPVPRWPGRRSYIRR